MKKMLVRLTIVVAVCVLVQMATPLSATEPPTETPELLADDEDDPTLLAWSSVSGQAFFDLVRGDLLALRQSLGNFTVSTEDCLADDLDTRSFQDADEPDEGEGFWYTVRAVNDAGNGTYDSLSASQVGGRDAGIDAAHDSCP